MDFGFCRLKFDARITQRESAAGKTAATQNAAGYRHATGVHHLWK
jgi:hypothetical protein